jgi:hypothetical protein
MTKAQIKQASVAAAELKMSTSTVAGDSRSDLMGISFLAPR